MSLLGTQKEKGRYLKGKKGTIRAFGKKLCQKETTANTHPSATKAKGTGNSGALGTGDQQGSRARTGGCKARLDRNNKEKATHSFQLRTDGKKGLGLHGG